MGWPFPPDEWIAGTADDFRIKLSRTLMEIAIYIVAVFIVLIILQAATVYLLYEMNQSKQNVVLLNREDVRRWVDKAVQDELREVKKKR